MPRVWKSGLSVLFLAQFCLWAEESPCDKTQQGVCLRDGLQGYEEGFIEESSEKDFLSKLWKEGTLFSSEKEREETETLTEQVAEEKLFHCRGSDVIFGETPEEEAEVSMENKTLDMGLRECLSRWYFQADLLFWQVKVPSFDTRYVDFLMNKQNRQEERKQCKSSYGPGFRIGVGYLYEGGRTVSLEWIRHKSSAGSSGKMYEGKRPIAVRVLPSPWAIPGTLEATTSDDYTIEISNLGVGNVLLPIACSSTLNESVFHVFNIVQRSQPFHFSERVLIRPSFGTRLLHWNTEWREEVRISLPPVIREAGLQSAPSYLARSVPALPPPTVRPLYNIPARAKDFFVAWGIDSSANPNITMTSNPGYHISLDSPKDILVATSTLKWINPLPPLAGSLKGTSPLQYIYEYSVQRDYDYECMAWGSVFGIQSTWNVCENGSLFSYWGLGLLYGKSTVSLEQRATSNPLYDSGSSTKISPSNGQWVVTPKDAMGDEAKVRSTFLVLEEGDVDLEDRSVSISYKAFHPCMDVALGFSWDVCFSGFLHTISLLWEAQIYKEAALTDRFSTEFYPNSDLFGGKVFEHPYTLQEMGFTASWLVSF